MVSRQPGGHLAVGNFLLFVYALSTSLALIFLKLGTTKDGTPIELVDGRIIFHLGLYSVSGIILYGLSFLVYTSLIAKFDLGYIIPLATAIVYVLIFIASFFIFKEVFTTLKILGIILILGGLILLNLK
jgi:drug/metabolite transporter (DMT)-like permease